MSFQSKRIRHIRIMELRNMAIRGANREMLQAKCKSWKVGTTTQQSYIEEVVESIQKVIAKQRKMK